MRHIHPGFCSAVFSKVRIEADGAVMPCDFASDGSLPLGNLNDKSFHSEIWNGVHAQDLRRGMYCDDVPVLCRNCRMRDLPEPMNEMYFLGDVMEESKWFQEYFRLGESSRDLEIISEHCQRYDEKPQLSIKTPYRHQEFLFSIALGGESHAVGGENSQVITMKIRATITDGVAQLEIPERIWSQMRTNIGYWWTAWQIKDDNKSLDRTTKIQCIIKHEQMPRLNGTELDYGKRNHLPLVESSLTNESTAANDDNENELERDCV